MPSQMRLLALPPCPAPLCGGRLSPETTLPGCSAPKERPPSTTAPQSESSSDEESESFVRLRAGLAAEVQAHQNSAQQLVDLHALLEKERQFYVGEMAGERQVQGIPCRPLIEQGGSLHCITMQLPEGVLA